MENPICPGCGRAVGLYNEEGELIAAEYHYPQVYEEDVQLISTDPYIVRVRKLIGRMFYDR